MFRQYDVWLADLNPRRGTEPGKTRPVLIVQSDLLNEVHPSSLICPITTNIHSDVSVLRIYLPKGLAGVNKDSSIMMDQIRAVDNRRLNKKLGRLPEQLMDRVRSSLKIVLDLE